MKELPNTNTRHRRANGLSRKIRYAVVGLGHIAQNAILPAFRHASENSELTALVSDDPVKLRALAQEYNVKHCFAYDDYERCLRSGEVDAVYIALPNHLHRNYCVRAAESGINVLCEKPLAVTEAECEHIIRVCAGNEVKLMTAYRLHFERGNLEVLEMVRSGKIGEPRIFNSLFTQQVRKGDIRTEAAHGAGTLYDIGIYCINAARCLFADEPVEGFCLSAASNDDRFEKVEEMTSALLRFPSDRLASFTTSFGAAQTADFEVIGTKGKLRASQAFDYSLPVTVEWTVDGRTRRNAFPLRDQFAPGLIYFSDCILKDCKPEPSGMEGLRDVHIIHRLYQSINSRAPVKLEQFKRQYYPGLKLEMRRPAVARPKLVHVVAPTR